MSDSGRLDMNRDQLAAKRDRLREELTTTENLIAAYDLVINAEQQTPDIAPESADDPRVEPTGVNSAVELLLTQAGGPMSAADLREGIKLRYPGIASQVKGFSHAVDHALYYGCTKNMKYTNVARGIYELKKEEMVTLTLV